MEREFTYSLPLLNDPRYFNQSCVILLQDGYFFPSKTMQIFLVILRGSMTN